MVTIYSTPTCQPCSTAVKILDNKGIQNKKIDLTEPSNSELLASLKIRLESDTISTPVFEHDGELYQGMHNLNGVIALAQAV